MTDDNIPFDPYRFNPSEIRDIDARRCRRSASVSAGLPPPSVVKYQGQTNDDVSLDYAGFANPTKNQVGPSCGGNGTENVFEVMLRREVPQDILHAKVAEKIGHLRWQLDGQLFWIMLRQTFYNGNLDGGVLPDEIAQLGKLTGIIEEKEAVVRIEPDGDARRDAYTYGPFGAGFSMAQTWGTPDWRGYIRPGRLDPESGHWLCMLGKRRQFSNWYDVGLNSWIPWGFHGLFILHAEFATYSMLDRGVQWRPSKGWWENYRWLEYVIESPAVG